MSVTICDIHGENISTLMSPIVFEKYSSGKSVVDLVKVKEIVEGNSDWGQCYLSTKKEVFDFYLPESFLVSEDHIEMYDEFISTLSPTCSLCVKKWIDSFNINADKLDLIIED